MFVGPCRKSVPFILTFPSYHRTQRGANTISEFRDLVLSVEGDKVSAKEDPNFNNSDSYVFTGTVEDLRRRQAVIAKVLEAIDATAQVERGQERLKTLGGDQCVAGSMEAPNKTY